MTHSPLDTPGTMPALLQHEVGRLLPPLPDNEFQELQGDLKEVGQLEPIVLYEGKILDGWHRYRACRALGIEPRTVWWDGRGGCPVRFVKSIHAKRRQMSPSQRAMFAVRSDAMAEARRQAAQRQFTGTAPLPEKIPEGEKKGEAREIIGQAFQVNPRYVQDAKTIDQHSRELADRVIAGTLNISQAMQQVRIDKKRRELADKASQAQQINDGKTTWTIYRGDCLDILPTLTERPRLIFADPPYNIGIDYGDGEAADRLPDEEYLAWVKTWMTACRDVLAPDGSFWLLICHEYAAEYAVLLKQLGFTIRRWITWYESFGVNCSQNFNRCSRPLFYCVLDPRQFVFHETAVLRESARQRNNNKQAAPCGKLWDDVWGIEPPIPRLTGTCKERIPDFPTQLPLALLRPIIQCATDPGDLVLDPFSGSGTTGVAALDNGRRYAGIELSKKFAELASQRLSAITSLQTADSRQEVSNVA